MELPIPRVDADSTRSFKTQFKKRRSLFPVIVNFVEAKNAGRSLGGKDKATGGDHASLGMRHFHLHRSKKDPILMYREDRGRIQLVAITTHAAAFGENEASFFQEISQELGEI